LQLKQIFSLVGTGFIKQWACAKLHQCKRNFTLLGILNYHHILTKFMHFYLWVLQPVAHLSNWFFMMPSIATKFQYVNSLCCDWRHHKEPVKFMQVILQLSRKEASANLDTFSTGKFNLISEYEHYYVSWQPNIFSMIKYMCEIAQISEPTILKGLLFNVTCLCQPIEL
jgi:hypothetical protein